MDEYLQLQRLTALLGIAHHLPGRIRLKLVAEPGAEVMDAVAEAKQFSAALDDIPGIRSVSLNVLARSCTVEYDTKVIPMAAWSDLVDGTDTPAARGLAHILITKYRAVPVA